MTIYRRMVRPT